MKQFNDENFDGATKSEDIALVMFAAPWAGPCNLVRPAFEAAASRFGNQMTFGEFNLDDNPETPQKYGVKQIPLFILMHNGVPIKVLSGAVEEDVLVSLCEEALE